MPFRISERDLDLLQLEELHADTKYADWFAAHLGLNGYTFVTAEHSVNASANGQSGETDVLAFFESGPSHIAVMIEDKIAANFTTRQADRYHERGEKLRDLGECTAYQTVLVAPQSYLSGVPASDPWNHRISVETLAEWFATQNGFRARWRQGILAEILRRAKTVANPNSDALRAFYSDFATYLAAQTKGALWHNLGRGDAVGPTIRFEGSSQNCMIWWKIKSDQMTLQLDQSFLNRVQYLDLPIGVSLQRPIDHNRSTEYVVIDVPPLDLSRPLAAQMDVVDQGIQAAMILRGLAQNLIASMS